MKNGWFSSLVIAVVFIAITGFLLFVFAGTPTRTTVEFDGWEIECTIGNDTLVYYTYELPECTEWGCLFSGESYEYFRGVFGVRARYDSGHRVVGICSNLKQDHFVLSMYKRVYNHPKK